MQSLRVSHRLYVIVAASIAVMLVIFGINWYALHKLSGLQSRVAATEQVASQIKHDSGLGAQAYRIIADTFINREFAESQRRWDAITQQFDASLVVAGAVAGSKDRKQSLEEAREAYLEVRRLYEGKFMELSKNNVTKEAISNTDGEIDIQIDKFDQAYGALEKSLSSEAHDLEIEFEAATAQAQRWTGLSILLAALVLVGITQVIAKSITSQLGMELSDATRFAHGIANGDLTHEFKNGSSDSSSLAAAFDHMLSTLKLIVSNVRRGSEIVEATSSEIAQGNLDLSSRTEQQASALQQTAASMGQLGGQVQNNTERARQANELAKNASNVAQKGGNVVGQVVSTMRGINESSRRISDIISVIDGIAFQTNILALNAAVEAARAGEQGRGFAVVATEVRSLAGRSAEAAKEIKSLINASVERVEQGTLLVDTAGATMSEIVQSIERVTSIMAEISQASADQAEGVEQVGLAVAQMDNATQQNAALVEQMASAAGSLNTQAKDLVQVVAAFKLDSHATNAKNFAKPAVRQRTPQAVPKPSPKHYPVLKPHKQDAKPLARVTTTKVVHGEDEWETF